MGASLVASGRGKQPDTMDSAFDARTNLATIWQLASHCGEGCQMGAAAGCQIRCASSAELLSFHSAVKNCYNFAMYLGTDLGIYLGLVRYFLVTRVYLHILRCNEHVVILS